VKWLPVWKHWLRQVIAYIQGSRILEISFGSMMRKRPCCAKAILLSIIYWKQKKHGLPKKASGHMNSRG
jgi:hypothetical protein